MGKACVKLEARGLSVGDKRQKEVRATKLKKDPTKKRNNKAPLQKKVLFFGQMVTLWPELQTLSIGSRGSTFGPDVALDSLFMTNMGSNRCI